MYKSMLALKCFNCGGIGHFYSKCPYKNKDSDEEEYYKREKKYQKGNKRRNTNKFFKKILYSKEESSSSDLEGNDNDGYLERVLFMVVEDHSEKEGEFDLRAELISELEELREEWNKSKSLKAELKMKEGYQNSNFEELEKMITSLKIQI